MAFCSRKERSAGELNVAFVQRTYVELQRLVVLALDLEFRLKFFDQQVEARDFGTKALGVLRKRTMSIRRRRLR